MLRAGSGLLAADTVVPGWFVAIGGVLTVVATVAAAYAVSRSAALRVSMTTTAEANAELRLIIADLRSEVATEKEKRAQLEGRIDVLTSGLAERIVAAVADNWRCAHTGPNPNPLDVTGGTS